MTAHAVAPLVLVVALTLAVPGSRAAGEPWTAGRIRALPDAAFAVVETAADGSVRRYLPHHDEAGRVDAAHLRAARARVGQVRWQDPRSEDAARRHLEEHERALAGR